MTNNETTRLQASVLPARAGWAWLPDAWRLWRRNPMLLILAVNAMYLLLLLGTAIPLLRFLPVFLFPLLSAGVYRLCAGIDAGTAVSPAVLWQPWRTRLRPLLGFGGVNLLFAVLLSVVLWVLVPAESLQSLSRIAMGEKLPLPSGAAQGILALMALALPVMMANWFAPQLIDSFALSIPKALVFSFIACWRNWRAFMCFGLAQLVFLFVLPQLLLSLIGVFSQSLMAVLMLAVMMVVLSLTQVTCYVTTRAIFARTEI